MVFSICVFNTANASNHGDGLKGFNTAVYGDCINFITAADAVGIYKDGGKSPQQAREKVVSRGVVGEFKDLHFELIEIAYSDENIDLNRKEFTEKITKTCRENAKNEKETEANKKWCKETIEGAALVAKYKDEEESTEDPEKSFGNIVYKLYKTENRPETAADHLTLILTPSHIDKDAREYVEYVTDIWCNLSREERSAAERFEDW